MALATVAFALGPGALSAQIEIEVEEFDGSCDRNVRLLLSQTGIPAGYDTLGVATFDLIFDDTKWDWVAPGVFDDYTDLDQTPAGSAG